MNAYTLFAPTNFQCCFLNLNAGSDLLSRSEKATTLFFIPKQRKHSPLPLRLHFSSKTFCEILRIQGEFRDQRWQRRCASTAKPSGPCRQTASHIWALMMTLTLMARSMPDLFAANSIPVDEPVITEESFWSLKKKDIWFDTVEICAISARFAVDAY